MAQYLGNLHIKRKITHPWEVVLRPHAYRDEITFALKPDLNVEKPKNLARLQTDIQVIAAGLVPAMQALSKTNIDLLEKMVQ